MEQRIQLLPQALQLLISEYNVDHRVQFRKVNQEFMDTVYVPCRICHAPFNREFCSVDYFIIQKYKLSCHWCDINCFHQDTDADIKLKCLTAVEEYMKGNS